MHLLGGGAHHVTLLRSPENWISYLLPLCRSWGIKFRSAGLVVSTFTYGPSYLPSTLFFDKGLLVEPGTLFQLDWPTNLSPLPCPKCWDYHHARLFAQFLCRYWGSEHSKPLDPTLKVLRPHVNKFLRKF